MAKTRRRDKDRIQTIEQSGRMCRWRPRKASKRKVPQRNKRSLQRRVPGCGEEVDGRLGREKEKRAGRRVCGKEAEREIEGGGGQAPGRLGTP